MKTTFLSLCMLSVCSMYAQTAWNLTGNSGTTPPTNFIGTTDNQDIYFKRNSLTCGYIGTSNTYFGLYAEKNISTGTGNTALGWGSIANNPTGVGNTAVGVEALEFNPFSPLTNNGNYNTGVGMYTGAFLTSGSNNTLLGYMAGYSLTTGSNNTIIGANIPAVAVNLSNTVIIADGSGNQRIYVDNTGKLKIPNLAGSGTRTVVVDANGNFSAVAGAGAPTLSWTPSTSALTISGGNTVNLTSKADYSAVQTLDMNNNTIADAYTINGVHDINFAIAMGINASAFGLEIGGNGTVGIHGISPSYDFYVDGTTWCTTAWSSSDKRFKKDIQPVNAALQNLLKLEGVSYNWKTEEFPDINFSAGLSYGVIAQDLEKVYPAMVKTDEKGYKAVSYDMLIPVLIESIKEQQTIIEEQNDRIDRLESTVNNLSSFNTSSTGSTAILYQNTPNPFSENTEIRCFIPGNVTNARISFYDMSGTLIETRIIKGTGEQTIRINGNAYINNIYVYSLYINDNLADSKKMVVSK